MSYFQKIQAALITAKWKPPISLEQIQELVERIHGLDKEEAYDHALDIMDYILSFDDETIKVFRIISAKNKKDIDLEKLGNHWTHSKEKALEFARQTNLKKPWYLFSATINRKDVDWSTTVWQMVHHSWEEEIFIVGNKLKNLKTALV